MNNPPQALKTACLNPSRSLSWLPLPGIEIAQRLQTTPFVALNLPWAAVGLPG